MLNRYAKKVVIESYDNNGIVAENCYVNVTAPGITVKQTKTQSGAFYRWAWIAFLTLEFRDEE